MDEGRLNFPMKKDRKPKVIVFTEPGKRRLEKRVRIGKEDESEKSDEELEFTDVAREVKKFGVTGFSRKEQRKSHQKYAEYLGAHKQKQQKVPYPILMERKRQKKIKEEKQKELERAMGVFKKKKKEDDTKLTFKLNLGRWVDKSAVRKNSLKDNSIRINKKEVFKSKLKR